MFFWKAETLLEALRRFQPKTATLLAGLPAFGHPDFAARLAKIFPLCENISVDYAVLEHATNVVGVACDDFGWSDVGAGMPFTSCCRATPTEMPRVPNSSARIPAGTTSTAAKSWWHCWGFTI